MDSSIRRFPRSASPVGARGGCSGVIPYQLSNLGSGYRIDPEPGTRGNSVPLLGGSRYRSRANRKLRYGKAAETATRGIDAR